MLNVRKEKNFSQLKNLIKVNALHLEYKDVVAN